MGNLQPTKARFVASSGKTLQTSKPSRLQRDAEAQALPRQQVPDHQ